jgi:hypothetical protein
VGFVSKSKTARFCAHAPGHVGSGVLRFTSVPAPPSPPSAASYASIPSLAAALPCEGDFRLHYFAGVYLICRVCLNRVFWSGRAAAPALFLALPAPRACPVPGFDRCAALNFGLAKFAFSFGEHLLCLVCLVRIFWSGRAAAPAFFSRFQRRAPAPSLAGAGARRRLLGVEIRLKI